MHILTAILLTIFALAILVLGLLRVLHELLERGPYDAPLVDDPPRHDDPAAWRADGETARKEIFR